MTQGISKAMPVLGDSHYFTLRLAVALRDARVLKLLYLLSVSAQSKVFALNETRSSRHRIVKVTADLLSI